MTGDTRSTLHTLSEPGQVIEVRAVTDDGIASGYFNDPDALALQVAALDDVPGVQGIYLTLNEVNPALLARRSNRIKMHLGKKDTTTADADIIRRRWFPVDIDPVRPSGVSSTGDEHRSALEKSAEVAAYLETTLGWPAPVRADSGNGAHLLYRVDLENNEESRTLVKKCLDVLALLFDSPSAAIDTANHNAARIWKLYGTMSRKGDHTSDRPHRRSSLLDIPQPAGVVSTHLLMRLAAALPDAPAAPGPGRSSAKTTDHPLDLRAWLTEHGIAIRHGKPYQGGTLYLLDQCPFSESHRDGAFAIQFASGAVYAGCHHTSCGSGAQRWHDLKDKYTTGRSRTRAEPSRPPGGTPPAPTLREITGHDEALAILTHGDPKKTMLQAFSLDHEGDETIAECLIMSLASRSVENTTGLHVSVTGESGKGKSHAFSTMLRQVPERFRLEGAMSNKALFYIDELQPGMAIVLDDCTLSDEMADILKGVTTSFCRPFMYRTVNKDRKGQICTIPERCVWWIAKVEGSGDDQVFNRMLTCWIDDSEEQDKRVLARILARQEILPEKSGRDRHEIEVCRAMWEILGQQRLHVLIPFATNIRFKAHGNRRNPGMLIDLIKAHALLSFMQRERQEADDTTTITATIDDFAAAAKLFSQLNGKAGGQMTKLTKRESDIITIIERSRWAEFTIPMLQKATGYSNGVLHRIMHGYLSRGSTYSGLLEKCPAISYTDRTVVTGDDETSAIMRRRTNAYTFDRDLFKVWNDGGDCWIDDDPDDDDRYPSALQQSYSNPSAPAEGQELNDADVNFQSKSTNTHICVYNNLSFSNSENTECTQSASAPAIPCVSEPATAEGQDEKSDLCVQIHKPPEQKTGFILQQVQGTAEGQGDSMTSAEGQPAHESYTPGETTGQDGPGEYSGGPPAGRSQVTRDMTGRTDPMVRTAEHPVKIRAAGYKKLDLPENRAHCHACGREGVMYVEKCTPVRERRKREPARRICRYCYDAAVRRDRAASPPLYGIISPAGMTRTTTDLGRCTVCNLGKAVYRDQDARVKLCEACYARECSRQNSSAEEQA